MPSRPSKLSVHASPFQLFALRTDQQPRIRLAAGNVRNGANHVAAMVVVPELEATLSPPVQRDGLLRIEQHKRIEQFETFLSQRKYSFRRKRPIVFGHRD